VADRYFSQRPISEDRVVLSGPEAHHLVHVMRAKPGSRVVLFDGSGVEFLAQVDRIERSRVRLAVLSHQKVDRELPLELTLGVALPKGDRQRWLVEKAVELGVARMVPLVTARSVARYPRVWRPIQADQRQGSMAGRLRRTAIEASKQCGRNRLMEITPPRAWPDYVAEAAEAPCRLLAQPGGHAPTPGPLSAADPAGPVFLAVGPEGGFTDDEVSLATAAGWQTIDLGPRILRVETAALVLVAMVCQIPRNPRQ
jgi:16S rRNA (uracil1498-N3)-methyltransferase